MRAVAAVRTFGLGWLPDQANGFCATNRGVAIETRGVTYPSNSRTADSFVASALCGGAIGKPNFGFPRARIRHGATFKW